MALPPPKWHMLLAHVSSMNSASARQDLSRTVQSVAQGERRVLLETYGQPRAGLVSIKDVAMLEALDACPELKQQVLALLPS